MLTRHMPENLMRARRLAGSVSVMPMRCGGGVDEGRQPAVQLLGVPAQRGGRLGVPGGVQAVLGEHEHPGAVGAERRQAALDGRR